MFAASTCWLIVTAVLPHASSSGVYWLLVADLRAAHDPRLVLSDLITRK